MMQRLLSLRRLFPINAFIASAILVFLAEMGDKTQLLGMAFATRYKFTIVLSGVLVATLANHFLAVALGDYLSEFLPMDWIQFIAALSFVFFGLWTLHGDKLDENEDKRKMSPFWTVAVAFFIAEMGDKTQLASIALAAKYHSIFFVWMGTTTGLMITNIIGIIVGVVLGKKIPEKAVRMLSAAVFIIFGYLGILDAPFGAGARWGILLGVSALVLGYLLVHSRSRK